MLNGGSVNSINFKVHVETTCASRKVLTVKPLSSSVMILPSETNFSHDGKIA